MYFSPIYTLGTTYVDDSAPRKSAPVYVSIVYLIGAIGPAAGYILGGVVVTLWVDPLDEAKVTSNDSRWVGQWWLGFLIASLMLFLTGTYRTVRLLAEKFWSCGHGLDFDLR